MGGLFFMVILAAFLSHTEAAGSKDADKVYTDQCSGKFLLLQFFKRSETACVKWYEGATLQSLSITLSALSGAKKPVTLTLKRSGILRIFPWREKVTQAEPLDSIAGKTLEAWQTAMNLRVPLDTRFLYLFPRVGTPNYPLFQLQPWTHIHNIDEVIRLVEGSKASTASWLQRKDGNSVTLWQPSYETISTLFPTISYRPVEFRDPERGLLKHFPSNMFSFPMKTSTFYCAAKIPMLISPLGQSQILEALSSWRGVGSEAAMLLARRSRDITTEQDPTLVVMQIYRGPQNRAVFHETVIHTQTEEAPVLTSKTTKRYKRAFFRNFLADNARFISRLGGILARLRITRCFVWKFAAMTNIDLEEAFSYKQSLSEGKKGFSSLQAFFKRPINYELLRPIDSKAVLVAPADSVIQNAFFVKPNAMGEIVDAHIPQVKGTTFSVSDFLFGRGSNQELRLLSPENRLFVGIYYLAPTDYHRFHSAADWKATKHIYLPGCIPSVRRSVLLNRNILDAFERTSVHGHWNPGNRGGPRMFFSMTFVAAMMVGGIDLFYRRSIDFNKLTSSPACGRNKSSIVYEYKKPVNICMGQELGEFKFGSTVVVIFEAPQDFEFHVPICGHVDVNSTAGTLRDMPRQTLPRCDFTYGNFSSALAYLDHLQRLLNNQPKTSERLAAVEQHSATALFDGHSENNSLTLPEGDMSDGGSAVAGSNNNMGVLSSGEGTSAQAATIREDDQIERTATTPESLPNGGGEDLEILTEQPDSVSPFDALTSTKIPADVRAAGIGLESVAPSPRDIGEEIVLPERADLSAVIERGDEKGEPPHSIFLGDRKNRHSALVKTSVGEETEFSSLANVESKIRAIEFGLLNRFALARWLQREWTAGKQGVLLLQVGQLPQEEADTSGARLPLCSLDAYKNSLLLRFEGQLSNLLLEMPADPSEAFLTRYPFFACGSPKQWGKATRGVTATWTVIEGNIYATFTLSLGRVVQPSLGALETVSYAFIGTLAQSQVSHNVEAAASPSESFALEELLGVNKYILSDPDTNRSEPELFTITNPDLLPIQIAQGTPSEVQCSDSPLQSIWKSAARLLQSVRQPRQK